MSLELTFENFVFNFIPDPSGVYSFGIIAKDLANVLDLDNHNKLAASEEYISLVEMQTNKGLRGTTVIWEPGIYEVLAKSRKPKAKPFQKWLFETVIPSIRKSGSYNVSTSATSTKALTGVDYADALAKVDQSKGPVALRQLIYDKLADELATVKGQKLLVSSNEPRKVGVAQKAEEMGYTVDMSNRGKLGKFVRKHLKPIETEDRMCVGQMRPVNVYEDTDELELLIHDFFLAQ